MVEVFEEAAFKRQSVHMGPKIPNHGEAPAGFGLVA
jgi:hypothetical protein